MYHINIPNIDLHNFEDISDALFELERQLFLLVQNKQTQCQVIHGIGSGALKDAVHGALAKSPLVKTFELSDDGGSTVVFL